MMESKYLSYLPNSDRGNFTAMLPGIVDVRYINETLTFKYVNRVKIGYV
jgi:hypothetical protein